MVETIKSKGAKEFRKACQNGNEFTVEWFLQDCQGLIDFGEANDKGQNGYNAAKEGGHTAIMELLANAGHGDKQEVLFLIV